MDFHDFGAATWAVLHAVTDAHCSAILKINYKAPVDLLRSGRDRAVRPDRTTARAWADILAATGGDPPADASWMPAHTAAAHVGYRRLGNGELLS